MSASAGRDATVGAGGSNPSSGGLPATAGGLGPSGGVAAVGDQPTSGAAAADPEPPRPLSVTAGAARYEHAFLASEADPDVSFNDELQLARVDTRAAKLLGKLVLPFGGTGNRAGHLGAVGEFCIERGFHVLAVAAFADYDVGIGDADFYGDARRQVFDGVEHTSKGAFAEIKMVPADGVAQRTQMALQYLQQQYPEEDWGYYLQADGAVRWSDVVFTGISHGGSNAARFGMLVRASKVVSIAGPRDNSCGSLDTAACADTLAATWLSDTPSTPIERFFGFTGGWDEQHPQHLFAMQRLGYVGAPSELNGQQPPYGGSHRLVADATHDAICGKPAFDDACNYAFDVPEENRAGVGE